MLIPKKQMQKIAEEVGGTIYKDVNIMDETGCIIASTDSNRIGKYHTGAIELLNNQLTEVVIEKEYKGTRSGINLPLTIEGKVIGVVGITGPVDEVRMLGAVIQKMTEILILDWYRSNQKKALEDLKRSFAVELLFGNDEKRLEFGWELLGLDMKLTREVAVIDVDIAEKNAQNQEEVFENILNKIKKRVEKNRQQIVIAMGMKAILFYQRESAKIVLSEVDEMKCYVESLYPCHLYCGIGSPGISKYDIQKSYKEADNACNYVKTSNGEDIKIYSSQDIRMLLKDIQPQKRKEYTDELFKHCNEEQKKEMLDCLRSYIRNNGSITKIADEMYIHKNTLQYRLNKIKSVTGYDPRVLQDAISLILGMYLYEIRD